MGDPKELKIFHLVVMKICFFIILNSCDEIGHFGKGTKHIVPLPKYVTRKTKFDWHIGDFKITLLYNVSNYSLWFLL